MTEPFRVADPTKTSLVKPCPECAAGKCGNCDGGSWDLRQDAPATCPCAYADHPRRTA